MKIENIEKKKHSGAGIVDHQGKENCVESFWDTFLVEIKRR